MLDVFARLLSVRKSSSYGLGTANDNAVVVEAVVLGMRLRSRRGRGQEMREDGEELREEKEVGKLF